MARISFAGETGRGKIVDLARGIAGDAPRVMPLGDSNTLGLTRLAPAEAFEGWRGALWDRVVAERRWIDYVGDHANGGPGLPDPEHQGVSGIRATTVLAQAPRIARDHAPDVVIVKLGTNDALNEANAAATVPGELLGILRAFAAVRPEVVAILAPLPPIDASAEGYAKRADAEAIRAAINDRLPEVAAAARAEGIDARVAPDPGLGPRDLYDGIHPTAAGHAKIAGSLHAALAPALEEAGRAAAIEGPAPRNASGSEAADFLRGDGRANRLDGRGGDDRIEGGGGRDVLTGGEGADVFVWRKPGHGRDRIRDFEEADLLEFSAAGFGGGLVPGQAPILRAGAAPEARGAAGQFLYDTEKGRLSWDPDGAGDEPAVLIARLRGAPAVTGEDFLIT